MEWVICDSCVKEFRRKKSLLNNERSKGLYCSMKCLGNARIGKNNHAYKEGRFIDSNGYTHILLPQGGYIKEHRLVMQDYLGRKLYSHEEIHHKNGNREDNRIENLELWTTSHPSSQRIEDKIMWAKEILREYANYTNDIGRNNISVYLKEEHVCQN